MEELWNSISAVLLILMMITVGYVFGRAGWMKSEQKSLVTKFLINIAVPCMCIGNVFSNFTREMLQNAGVLLTVPVLFNLITFALAYGMGKLLKIPQKRFGGFVVMCAFSNSLFVGYPICYELFGDAGIPYLVFYYVVNTAAFWSLGCLVIYRSGNSQKKFTLLDGLKKLVSPPLVALAAAIVLLLCGVTLPHLVSSFCSYMGATVTPLALLYVGFVIYETGLKNLRPDRGIWAATGMRFLVCPALIFAMCLIFNVPAAARSVFAVESAMPVMTQSVVVSGIAGADEKYNALGMSFTTLLCLVAVPVLMLVLG